MLTIFPIPAFQDNYIWTIVNHDLHEAIVVDPGDAVVTKKYLTENNLNLRAIFLTHKHADHIGGVQELLSCYKNTAVYANPIEKISFATHAADESEKIKIAQWQETFSVIEIPGHTLGHVAFYCAPHLFCGDTLFSAGCGRVFEGTHEQMLNSLKKLSALSDDTLIYCGHEYTLANLKFASAVEPENQEIKNKIDAVIKSRAQGQSTLPSRLQNEKKINPFLRCHIDSVMNSVSADKNELAVFTALRNWKNQFK